ncbi:hypothetical protein Nhal_2562 [Nitrosococcus halophilus Nc 4]|uniref:Uncharacterized protein n=1 Tax=Nitrosococcus halophilus (strain Nc4) TaxID=472759 RepID=D5BWI4_NITHN|nr:hypothetical protein Nhal_2562 [Nitrosococcus halophilus Nc 4]
MGLKIRVGTALAAICSQTHLAAEAAPTRGAGQH